MKKALKIIVAISVLSLAGLLVNGACERAKTPDGTTPSVQVAGPITPLPAVMPTLAPDPANAVRFTLVYQNNVNGEIEPCG